MTTAIGILIIVAVFAVKYGGSVVSGASWLWSKVPPIQWPASAASAIRSPGATTAAQATAGLEAFASFKANSKTDPMYAALMAAAKALVEAA